MTDELDRVGLAAYQSGLSQEYVEALTRAFEVYCARSERAEKAYVAKQGEPATEEDMEPHVEAVAKLQVDAFLALMSTAGTANPKRRSRADMPTGAKQ